METQFSCLFRVKEYIDFYSTYFSIVVTLAYEYGISDE